jgi:hypothetical protein
MRESTRWRPLTRRRLRGAPVAKRRGLSRRTTRISPILSWTLLFLSGACALVLSPPSARAQTPWGVYLCQTYTVHVSNFPNDILQQDQYPGVSSTNCDVTTTIQEMTLTNSLNSGQVIGMGDGFSDNASASLSGTAALGTLSASAGASAVATPGVAYADIIEALGWTDTFTITSSAGLPKGTPVTLKITVTYSGKIVEGPSGLANVDMLFAPGGGGAGALNPATITSGIYLSSLDGTNTLTATLPVTVGIPFQPAAIMNVYALESVGDLSAQSTVAGADSLLPASNPDFTFTVNIDPVQPCISYTTASQTTYFSGAAPSPCSGPPTCAQIVQGQVHTATGWTPGQPQEGLPVYIGAQFTPNYGYTLNQAATACGFDHFDFQQVVTGYQGPLPAACSSTQPTVPTLDPPVGGWEYEGCDDSNPFYYSQSELATTMTPYYCPLNGSSSDTNQNPVETASTLTFCDGPTNPNLTSGVDSFWTVLVGVSSNGAPIGAPYKNTSTLTPLWAMTWTDSFNGMAEGGIRGPFLTGNFDPPPLDSTSGTGGIVILNSGAPVPGDVNGDGVVNCADLAVVKASFGKKLGQVGFDPRADVNFDGVVNIIDLSTVARALPPGTTCN